MGVSWNAARSLGSEIALQAAIEKLSVHVQNWWIMFFPESDGFLEGGIEIRQIRMCLLERGKECVCASVRLCGYKAGKVRICRSAVD